MTNEKPWRIADLLADLTFVPLGNGRERATINGVQIVRQNAKKSLTKKIASII